MSENAITLPAGACELDGLPEVGTVLATGDRNGAPPETGVLYSEFDDARTLARDAVTDRLIVSFQRRGDQPSFDALYLRFRDAVNSFAASKLRGSAAEAEDVTQEVFSCVATDIGRFSVAGERPFRAWLFTITRNCVVDLLRAHGRREGVIERLSADMTDASEQHGAGRGVIAHAGLLEMVDGLPVRHRQVVWLRYEVGLDFAEIAGTLDRTVDDVRVIHRRALVILRRQLDRDTPVLADWKFLRTAMWTRLRRLPVLGARRWALWQTLGVSGRAR